MPDCCLCRSRVGAALLNELCNSGSACANQAELSRYEKAVGEYEEKNGYQADCCVH